MAPTSIADIRVVETVKEGKTIFRLDPTKAKRASASAPNISPMFAAFAMSASSVSVVMNALRLRAVKV